MSWLWRQSAYFHSKLLSTNIFFLRGSRCGSVVQWWGNTRKNQKIPDSLHSLARATLKNILFSGGGGGGRAQNLKQRLFLNSDDKRLFGGKNPVSGKIHFKVFFLLRSFYSHWLDVDSSGSCQKDLSQHVGAAGTEWQDEFVKKRPKFGPKLFLSK
jgi:hypothetical protein